MKYLKLKLEYIDENNNPIIKVVTVPIPKDKEQDIFDFEAALYSCGEELGLSVIQSNVQVVTWKDYEQVPTEEFSKVNANSELDTLVVTSPRLPDDDETIMVFCPISMEDMVQSGEFAKIYNGIRDTYEGMYWNSNELIVYFKNGIVTRYVGVS